MDRLPDNFWIHFRNLKKSPNSFKTILSCLAVEPLHSCLVCVHVLHTVWMCVCVCVFIMVHLIVFSKLLFPPSVQMEAVTRTVSCPPTVRQVRDSWRFTVSSTCSLWNLQPACLQMIPLTSKNSTPTQWSKHYSHLIWKLNYPQIFMRIPQTSFLLLQQMGGRVLLMRNFFQKECRKWKLISLACKS